MKFKDLKVGMDVLVLRGGDRYDLGSAFVERCTVLSEERWVRGSRGYPSDRTTVALPDGGEVAVRARPSQEGRHVLVRRGETGGTDLVPAAKILGPADEWQPKVDAARQERYTALRERSERQALQVVLAEQLGERCVELTQQITSAGIAASVRSVGGVSVSIVLEDLATAERVVNLLTAASGHSKALAAEMPAALDRYHATGEMGEFIAAQKRCNDEEARLRRALYELTGKHYEPSER